MLKIGDRVRMTEGGRTVTGRVIGIFAQVGWDDDYPDSHVDPSKLRKIADGKVVDSLHKKVGTT